MSESIAAALPEPEWAAFMAIDWADRKNFWRLRPVGSQSEEHGELDNTPEAVEAWAAMLEQRFTGRPVATCLEQSRGALVYMLSKYPHLVLYPVHPTTAADYRKTFRPSGAKSDPGDTASLLDLLCRHREKLRCLRPDTQEIRLLHFLVEQRRKMVEEKTRATQRLTECLKRYFPQVPRWFDVTTVMVRDLLGRWPQLPLLQHAHPGTLRQFFGQHNCRAKELLEERIANIYQAVAATHDEAVLEAGILTTNGLLVQLTALRDHIAVLERRIAELVNAHPDGALFRSFPGAGEALVPRLMVAFGSYRDRYQSALELQRYSGIAPIVEGSGNSRWVHYRLACPKFLRQTFHEFAYCSIGYSEWAKAYYDHQRQDEKKEHHAAVRSLAYKWIRILYRCWKDRKPYEEQIYLQSLRRRGALLAGILGPTTSAGWQSIAGFQKFSGK